MNLTELVERAHAASRSKGWYDGASADRNVGELPMLVTTEVAEAMEEARLAPRDELRLPRYEGPKPVGFASEIADAFIRLGDLCGYLGIDIERAIVEKMAFNETRPYRHGGKRA